MKIDFFIKIVRFIIILIFLFGFVSYLGIKAFQKEERDRSFLDNLSIKSYELPKLLKTYLKVNFKKHEQAIEINDTLNLYAIGNLPKNSSINDSLSMLYYKFLGNEKGKIYMQGIKNGDVYYSWDIPLNVIMSDLNKIRDELNLDYFNKERPINLSTRIKRNYRSIQISAPVMFKDSSIIFHCGSLGHVYRIDKNSNILWKSKKLSHHSIEIDSQNNIWTCSVDLDSKQANYHKYREDAILCLTPEGNEKHFFPLTDIFESNNLFKRLIGSSPNHKLEFGLDPYHLNDILPVEYDSKYWKKGDLFLSMRHQSMVLQYRPSNDSIVWYQQGPWLGQHDINIVNDSIISVFNNNVWFFKNKGNVEPNTTSNIAYFDFSTESTNYKHNNIFTSPFRGRQTRVNNNLLIVESTERAIYYAIDSAGNVESKFYIPYFSDPNKGMNPTWARVYKKDGNSFLIQ